MNLAETIAQRVKQAREEAGLTQQKLAEMTGLTVVSISQIENGRTKSPKIENLVAIAEATGHPLDFFVVRDLGDSSGRFHALFLRKLRERAGLSRQEMAERVGLSERTLALYEAGRPSQILKFWFAFARAVQPLIGLERKDVWILQVPFETERKHPEVKDPSTSAQRLEKIVDKMIDEMFP